MWRKGNPLTLLVGTQTSKATMENSMLLLLLLSCFSRVRLTATPWTAAYQAPLSMGYSRQEYWSTKVLKCHCLLGKQYGDSLKKLGIKLPYDPEIPLLGIHPKKTRIERDTCIPVFTAALFNS